MSHDLRPYPEGDDETVEVFRFFRQLECGSPVAVVWGAWQTGVVLLSTKQWSVRKLLDQFRVETYLFRYTAFWRRERARWQEREREGERRERATWQEREREGERRERATWQEREREGERREESETILTAT